MRPPPPRRHAATLALAAAVVAVATATACGEGRGADDAAVTDSAGVAIVRHRAAAPETLTVGEPLTRIGVAEGDTAYQFQYVMGVLPLADGRIVVLDRVPRVALFDARGRWLRDLGRRGGGPGEYRVAAWMTARGDTVDVWDVARRRFVSHTAEGADAGGRELAGPAPGRRMRPLGGGWVDERERGQGPDTGIASGTLLRRAPDGAVLDTVLGPYPVPEAGWRVTDEVSGAGHMVNPPALAVHPPWDAHGATLAWSAGVVPHVLLLDADGRLRRRVELARPVRPVTGADRDAHLRGLAERFGMDAASLERARAGTVFTDTLPTIAALRVDDAGRVWAAEVDPAVPLGGMGRAWDVLDGDGRLLRHVRFPPGFELHAVRAGRAYGVRTGDEGVQVVEVYAVDR